MRWIRKRIVWIAGATVAGLVFWLIATVVSLRATRVDSAGTLFGRPVTADKFLKALSGVTHQAVLSYGETALRQIPQTELRQRAWEWLLLVAEARRLRIRVSDREVIEELGAHPLFRSREGRFDSEGYRQIVQYSLGTTPRAFEEEIRESLLIRKLVQSVVGDPAISEAEVLDLFRRREESIRVAYLLLPGEDLAREIADAARQEPGHLEKLARQLNRKVKSTDFFKRQSSLPELGTAERIFGPAFELKPGETTGPLGSPKGWIVTRLQAKEETAKEPDASEKKKLQEELRSQKKLQLYLTWYQDLKARADLRASRGGGE